MIGAAFLTPCLVLGCNPLAAYAQHCLRADAGALLSRDLNSTWQGWGVLPGGDAKPEGSETVDTAARLASLRQFLTGVQKQPAAPEQQQVAH